MYAEHEADLGWIWNKVNKLTSLTMGNPSGASGTGYGVYGNIVYLQIGDLIKENGFLSDVTMNVDTASPWEIDPKVGQLPFICTLSISFQVVRNDKSALPNTGASDTGAKTTSADEEKFSLKNLESRNPNKEKFSLKNLENSNPNKEKFSLKN
jgi:hypothetical protein